ncbi:hypothetical protein [uncultured Sunxiuqinia sp.]|uniref:hypothetical protein n=1 Tax=uncultured Sunxiuqinia sp. TaxID=1573825 RepID=UPI0026117AE0|nr:hypothetical protein [uncultured Sunxiuqinia sp.]
MKRISAFVIVLLIFWNTGLKAQQPNVIDDLEEARLDSLLNEVIFNDDELSYLFGVKQNYQFLYWRSNFDSQTFFAGREIGNQQYNLSSQLFYLHSKGFYAGIAGAWYSQLEPGYGTTVLTAGYARSLKKMKFLRYRLSYDYFIYNNDDPDFDPLYSSGVDLGVTLKSEHFGTRFDTYLLMGKEVGATLSWDVYAYLNLVQLRRYDKIRFEPELSLYFGSELVEYQLNAPIIDPDTNTEIITDFKDVFGLMNLQLQVPLSVKYKSFDFEAAWIYNIPRTMDEGLDYPNNSFLRFSLGYIFNL